MAKRILFSAYSTLPYITVELFGSCKSYGTTREGSRSKKKLTTWIESKVRSALNIATTSLRETRSQDKAVQKATQPLFVRVTLQHQTITALVFIHRCVYIVSIEGLHSDLGAFAICLLTIESVVHPLEEGWG